MVGPQRCARWEQKKEIAYWIRFSRFVAFEWRLGTVETGRSIRLIKVLDVFERCDHVETKMGMFK